MNSDNNLLEKIKKSKASWQDLEKLLDFDENTMKPYFELAQKLKLKYLGNPLKIYTPGKKFPAFSVTGGKCALRCEHCNKKYLKGMRSTTESKDLKERLLELKKSGGVGALISGGCTSEGLVPLGKFLKDIAKVKKETDLIINTHTGLVGEKTAKDLAKAGVDIVSFDINMDPDIIHEIYHLDKNLEDYKNAIKILNQYELNIVPHVCIGLYYGELHKELDSLRFIKETGIEPSLIVFIALIPPSDSKNPFKTPNPLDIAKVITIARFAFPDIEISLGCMRPRKKVKRRVEKLAIKGGINRIEIPSKKTLKWAKESFPEIEFKFYSACCAIPERFEYKALSSELEIKKYQF